MNSSSKKGTRGEIRTILKNLDSRWLTAASSSLCANLTRLIEENFAERTHLLAWMRFFTGEPDLSSFVGEQLELRQVFLPQSRADFSMQFVSISLDWQAKSKPGVYGIPEPSEAESPIFDPAYGENSIVLVPGLAFDHHGNRLGRGKGYYDRFLSKPYMRDAVKIGVAWSLQIVEKLEVKDHDVPVDWICTERQAIKIP